MDAYKMVQTEMIGVSEPTGYGGLDLPFTVNDVNVAKSIMTDFRRTEYQKLIPKGLPETADGFRIHILYVMISGDKIIQLWMPRFMFYHDKNLDDTTMNAIKFENDVILTSVRIGDKLCLFAS